jgi:restriction system protein
VAIPDFQTLTRPILAAHEEQAEWERGSLRDRLADEFGLTPDERARCCPAGGNAVSTTQWRGPRLTCIRLACWNVPGETSRG